MRDIFPQTELDDVYSQCLWVQVRLMLAVNVECVLTIMCTNEP